MQQLPNYQLRTAVRHWFFLYGVMVPDIIYLTVYNNSHNMKNIGRIISLSKRFNSWFALACFLIVIGVVVNLALPIFSKLIVDQISMQISGKGGNLNELLLYVFLFFLTGVFYNLSTALSNRVGDHISGKLRAFWTETFYYKILTLPQSYYDSEMSGKIINQLTRGLFVMQSFVNTATNFIIPAMLQGIVTIVFLSYYSWQIGLITFAIFPVYILISYHSTKQWGKYEKLKNPLEDRTRSRMSEVIGNIKLVKSFITEPIEFGFVKNNLKQINEHYAKQSTEFHTIDFIRELSLTIVIGVVTLLIFKGTFEKQYTLGEMILLLQLLNQARWPLFGMSFILARIQEAEAGTKEYFEILDTQGSEQFETKSKYSSKKFLKTDLGFEHVAFTYEKSQPVLKDVSFKLHNKEKVALVGHSGAGKSTIVNLILKFYNVTKGDIKLNGESYRTMSHQVIRNNISLVFQENELFSTTIRENVAYGNPDTTDKEVVSALKLANAWDFVSGFEKGIETEVGERGVRLSGGQKQRIQIARAILKNSPILILDEATSSLDSKSEMEVQKGLENLMKNRLTIIIAHRFSTIQNVDTILVIENGRISQQGNPKELSTKPGVYKDLLTYQIQGNEKLLKQFGLH